MRQAAYVYYKISTLSPLSIISIRTKRQISNKIITLPDVQYWFYPRCRVQAQYTFCDKKGDGQKDSNLIQAQVQVRF